MKQFISIVFAVLVFGACVHEPRAATPANDVRIGSALEAQNDATEAAIFEVMNAQSDAWNRGDIPAFMEHYWKDDQLRFGSGGNITRGWQATLDRYLRTYSSREQMGQLDFSDLEVHPLADDAAIVHGRWRLVRQADTPSGLFTLVFRNFGAGWVIVSDTTTSG